MTCLSRPLYDADFDHNNFKFNLILQGNKNSYQQVYFSCFSQDAYN